MNPRRIFDVLGTCENCQFFIALQGFQPEASQDSSLQEASTVFGGGCFQELQLAVQRACQGHPGSLQGLFVGVFFIRISWKRNSQNIDFGQKTTTWSLKPYILTPELRLQTICLLLFSCILGGPRMAVFCL